MNQIDFFVIPKSFFNIIEDIKEIYPMTIIFRRFKVEGMNAGFRILDREEDLFEVYRIGGYSQIYISFLSDLPTDEKDWDFLDRNADNLIIIEGGRIENNYLEMFRLRLASKNSDVKHIFKHLKKAIAKSCSCQGLNTKSGQFYKKILYNDEVLAYELRYDISRGCKSFVYVK